VAHHRLFGTDGVRGIANADLTAEIAFRLGEAAGRLLAVGHAGRFVVGRDTRRSGDMLEAALVAGICSAGSDALLAGIVPTPAVAFLTRELGADGGIVISASHNPSEYNGIKFFSRDGFKLSDEAEGGLDAFVTAQKRPLRPTGAQVGVSLRIADAIDRYVDHAIATVPERLDGLTVALDCAHGSSASTSRRAFEALGAEVVAINCDWNGTDINAGCGSTELGPLRDLVRSTGADLGIAHDGDADRVLAVDETGMEVDGDQIMAICAAQLHRDGRLNGDTVVGTVMTNLGFVIAMESLGIRVLKARVGDRYVLDEMRTTGAVLGGEQSGHVIFLADTTTGDGLITALQLMRVMRRTGEPLSSLARIMERYPQVLVNVRVAEKGRLSANPVVAAAAAREEELLGSSGRVLIRESGTEPLVRVMVEAADEKVARQAADRLVEAVRTELA
jgi:phosphoglucosamine mutase